MTYRDLVMLALGEILLVLTFLVGMLVGVSLQKRKDSP